MSIALTNPLYLIFLIFIPLVWFYQLKIKSKNHQRKKTMIFLRTLLILLMVLVLTNPKISKNSDVVNLFYLVDISKSIRNAESETIKSFIEKTSLGMGEEDKAGLIYFGGNPSLEVSLNKNFDVNPLQSEVNTNHTNINKAIQFAVGKLPSQGKNKLVVMSDGNQNIDDANDSLQLAKSLGVEINSVSVSPWIGEKEIYLDRIETPTNIQLNTPFDVRIIVQSRQSTKSNLILLRNGDYIAGSEIDLKKGKNVFLFNQQVKAQGLYSYKAIINADNDNDNVYQNNEGVSFTQATEKNSVLYVTNELRDNVPIVEALKTQGIHVTRKTPDNLPFSIQGYLDYGAVILNNIPAQELSVNMMENIEKYVRDTAGGLVMIGGPNSFGAGGYLKTPIEKALPVFMDVPTTLEFPGLCIVMVIDKSASMSGSISGQTKLEAAKLALFSSIELLNPKDKVGILAFDWEQDWIIPITTADDRIMMAEKLSVLSGGGGTDIYNALFKAHSALKMIPAAKKHIILLSDGMTKEAKFKSFVEKVVKDRISISTVALGQGSDIQLMKNIARWGEGRDYYTDDIGNIPRIFVGETRIVAKEIIVEKQTRPIISAQNEIIQKLPTSKIPNVGGYIITYPKNNAEVILETTHGPLLVSHQYGLGRSVAFTSDLSGRWGKNWVKWDYYAQFVSQMIKWTIRKESPHYYDVDIQRQGDKGIFKVDIIDELNQYSNRLNLNLKVLLPDKNDETIQLEQVAPGQYVGEFSASAVGEYFFNLFGENSDHLIQYKTFGYSIPYSDEYLQVTSNDVLLKELAVKTGGKMLNLKEPPEDLFLSDSQQKVYGAGLWPYLLLAAIAVLILEITLRKLQTLNRF